MSNPRDADTVLSSAGVTLAPARQGGIARSIAAITIANGLEFFDFAVYSYFATILGKLFFPATSSITQLLMSLATFGVGFVARPLGGIVIGSYADRAGRKAAMTLSLWLMAAGSAVFVLVPTYAQIGAAAPRAADHRANDSRLCGWRRGRGFHVDAARVRRSRQSRLFRQLAAFQRSAQHHTRFADRARPDHGAHARATAVMGVAVAISRRYRADSYRVLHSEVPGRKHAAVPSPRSQRGPLAGVFREYRGKVVLGVLITAGATSSNYMALHYLTNYAVGVLKMPLSAGMWASLVAGGLEMLLAAFAGIASDRCGRKPVATWSRIALLVSILPAFAWLSAAPDLPRLLTVAAVMILPTVFITVSATAMISEFFPRAVRATGVSIV